MTAFDEGKEAQYSDLTRKQNPYKKDTDQHRQWDRGWCRGAREEESDARPPKRRRRLYGA